MALEQVVTIHPDGRLSGLQRKGETVDLRQFGHAQIKRASLIEWVENKQAYEVQFLTVPGIQFLVHSHMVDAYGDDDYDVSFRSAQNEPPSICYFNEYEDAVKAEIKVLDYFRLQGLID